MLVEKYNSYPTDCKSRENLNKEYILKRIKNLTCKRVNVMIPSMIKKEDIDVLDSFLKFLKYSKKGVLKIEKLNNIFDRKIYSYFSINIIC